MVSVKGTVMNYEGNLTLAVNGECQGASDELRGTFNIGCQ